MNFAPGMPEPKFTSDRNVAPRISEPKTMTRSLLGRAACRAARSSASRVVSPDQRIGRCVVAGKELHAALPSDARRGICAKLVACRRSLIDREFTT